MYSEFGDFNVSFKWLKACVNDLTVVDEIKYYLQKKRVFLQAWKPFSDINWTFLIYEKQFSV